MTDADIISLYDSSNITLYQLSIISGRTINQLKRLLMAWERGFTMTKNEFMLLCYEQLIDPQCALEDENLRQAIADKNWERVRYIIMYEFWER